MVLLLFIIHEEKKFSHYLTVKTLYSLQ